MNIAVLGGGVEGTAVKKYFLAKGDHVQIFDNFKDEDIDSFKLEDYDMVFRSPSVHPLNPNWTSMTKYFFDNCKAKIIGVTGTKGKGTTCSLIAKILEDIIKSSEWQSRKVWLVGNIGNPSIEALDNITEDDVVVFEMSSFQLWDLNKSPNVSVVLRVEEDHLDRHYSLEDYHNAKANIAKYQTPDDCCIFYNLNENSERIGNLSAGTKYTYPIAKTEKVEKILDALGIPGEHNKENLEAALLAVSAFFKQDLNVFLNDYFDTIKTAVETFHGLPHRIEFVRNLNEVDYYDDNYSSAFPATDVAIKTFENRPLILIAGGKDRHLDLTNFKRRIFDAKNIKKVFLIGENKELLAKDEYPEKYVLCETLEDAVNGAKTLAEEIVSNTESNYDLCIPSTKPIKPVVLMSPGSASFDMFKNFEDRGQKYKEIVNNLK